MNNNIIYLSPKDINLLVKLSLPYKVDDWFFPKWHYGSVMNIQFDKLTNFRKKLFLRLSEQGFFILDLSYLLENHSECETARVVTFIKSLVGKPIKIIDVLDTHWRQINLDLNVNPNRSQGIGGNPLHIDFANVEFPPDYIALFMIRPDPHFGGKSTLANIENIDTILPVNSLRELRKKQFKDREPTNLSFVGNSVIPYSIISDNSYLKYRITGQELKHFSKNNKIIESAIQDLYLELENRKITFALKSGQLLVINQHKMVHGKDKLGDHQENIDPENRRLLMHGFIRDMTINSTI